jgi:EpsI family protein
MAHPKTSRTALLVALLMCAAAVAGIAARPGTKAADRGNAIVLKDAVPAQFGEWRELVSQGGTILPDPATQKLLNDLYSQLLVRTYVNAQGYRIMLSMAYGDDQRGGLQAHRPEVCYPAQGFKLGKVEDGTLSTSFGNIEVRRLTTALGSREEPVTYWLTVGSRVIRNRFEKRMEEIRLGLTGQIPDGLLFRVSSIDKDPVRAFAMQQKFTAEMMASVPAETRRQLSGLAPASGVVVSKN